MLDDVLEFLACPHCGAQLSRVDGTVSCSAGHAFDVARQGYVNLRPGGAGAGTGDTAPMVSARERFLGAGHYGPLADRVVGEAVQALAHGPPGCVVDIGAGTGWYLARVLDRLPDRRGLALDVSRYALRRAARAHPHIGAVGCDVWRGLPVREGAAALVLDLFAPRNAEEMARVLHPDGALLVAAPTSRHLAELVDVLGLLTVDVRKQERLERVLGPHFAWAGEAVHERSLTIGRAEVLALAGMGPSARHYRGTALHERVSDLPEPTTITVSVTVSTYRRRT